jgi:hypothetical protein
LGVIINPAHDEAPAVAGSGDPGHIAAPRVRDPGARLAALCRPAPDRRHHAESHAVQRFLAALELTPETPLVGIVPLAVVS